MPRMPGTEIRNTEKKGAIIKGKKKRKKEKNIIKS